MEKGFIFYFRSYSNIYPFMIKSEEKVIVLIFTKQLEKFLHKPNVKILVNNISIRLKRNIEMEQSMTYRSLMQLTHGLTFLLHFQQIS